MKLRALLVLAAIIAVSTAVLAAGYVINENSQRTTLNCNNEMVTINGNENVIVVRGNCPLLSLNGNENTVRVEGWAARIQLLGNRNKVTWKRQDGKGKPVIAQFGSENTVNMAP